MQLRYVAGGLLTFLGAAAAVYYFIEEWRHTGIFNFHGCVFVVVLAVALEVFFVINAFAKRAP